MPRLKGRGIFWYDVQAAAVPVRAGRVRWHLICPMGETGETVSSAEGFAPRALRRWYKGEALPSEKWGKRRYKKVETKRQCSKVQERKDRKI